MQYHLNTCFNQTPLSGNWQRCKLVTTIAAQLQLPLVNYWSTTATTGLVSTLTRLKSPVQSSAIETPTSAKLISGPTKVPTQHLSFETATCELNWTDMV